MTTMRIRRGDTFAFEQQLVWNDNTPIDLTDASSVDFVMIADGEVTPAIDSPATIDAEHKTEGYVTYEFKPGETDRIGMYKILFRVNWVDGTTMMVPNMGWNWLWIMSWSGSGSTVYETGETIRLRGFFYGFDGKLGDLDAAPVATVYDSSDTIVATGTCTKQSTGVYYYDVVISVVGEYHYIISGNDDGLPTSVRGSFSVV